MHNCATQYRGTIYLDICHVMLEKGTSFLDPYFLLAEDCCVYWSFIFTWCIISTTSVSVYVFLDHLFDQWNMYYAEVYNQKLYLKQALSWSNRLSENTFVPNRTKIGSITRLLINMFCRIFPNEEQHVQLDSLINMYTTI